MTWYWYLALVLLVFNVGFVCGAWLGGSTTNGLFRTRGLVARFVCDHSIEGHENLQVQKGSF